MSVSRKIIAVQFVEWMHKHRYAKYWGSDKPNCEKWYVMNTMPDRMYYTLEELYDIFEREQNDYKQQGNCNKPAVIKSCENCKFDAECRHKQVMPLGYHYCKFYIEHVL